MVCVSDMEPKAPVMLLVLIESARLRWFVASIGFDGQTTPLICAEEDDLAKYRELPFDEQVAFLRHRFCGVLQRGCDRLWARNQKARQFVFVFEGVLTEPTGQLTQTVAGHFAEWLLNPPVAVFSGANTFNPDELERLVGSLEPSMDQLLHNHLRGLLDAQQNPAVWEPVRKNGAWC
jgi:hypothetical protein